MRARGEIWKLQLYLRTTPGGAEKALALEKTLQERLEAVAEAERGQEAWKVLQEVQELAPQELAGEELWNPLHYCYVFGEVVANGLAIVRVRLLSANGVILEDTVEDGLVVFLSNQPLVPPVQAELYDRAGELVKSQTVFQMSVG